MARSSKRESNHETTEVTMRNSPTLTGLIAYQNIAGPDFKTKGIPFTYSVLNPERAVKLASSDFSDVYRLKVLTTPTAKKPPLPRMVAVKILQPGPKGQELFNTEAGVFDLLQTLKSGTSNLLVPLCSSAEFIKSGPKLCFLLPLARTDLHQFFKTEDATRYQKSLLAQIAPLAAGLETLHATGIAHCDLGPSNILVFDHGVNEVVLKICDFGHSVIADRQSFEKWTMPTRKKNANASNGTYSAPECWSRRRFKRPPVDIWALGCIFIEIVAFVRDGQDGLMHLKMDPQGPSAAIGIFMETDTFCDRVKLRVEVEEWLMLLGQDPEYERLSFVLLEMLQQDPDERPVAEAVVHMLASTDKLQPATRFNRWLIANNECRGLFVSGHLQVVFRLLKLTSYNRLLQRAQC
jgi:serine/threonine protein kinase